MKIIESKEDLKEAIESRFKFRRDYLEYLKSKGFDISETILSNHLAGRKNFTNWHKMAYSFSFVCFDFEGSE
ncbi:MAG: hypothetical protein AAFO07_04220 [Bacteroidota bacterium]